MKRAIVFGLLAVLLIGVGLVTHHFAKLGRIGSGYAAHQTCSCLKVSHRSLESCRGELDPLAQKLVDIDVRGDEVRARSLLWSSRAVFEEGWGCTLIE
jgi:hypothetical protein